MQIHIDNRILEVLKQKHITVNEFAEMCASDRTNMYRILKKENIDLALLRRFSIKLQHNFFKDLSEDFEENNLL